MSELNESLVSVLLVAGVLLIGAMMVVLLRLVGTIRVIEAELRTLISTLTPLLQKVDGLTAQATEAIASFQEHRDDLAVAVRNIRTVTGHIARLETLLFNQLEPSVTGLASMLAGVRKGLATFIEQWKRGR